MRFPVIVCIMILFVCTLTCEAGLASFQLLGSGPCSDGWLTVTAVSGDGSTLVGTTGGNCDKPFLWTATGGVEIVGTWLGDASGEASDVSWDGTVVVGNAFEPDGFFYWNSISGKRVISGYMWAPVSVSADGLVVVGSIHNQHYGDEPFRWTKQTGVQRLGYPPNGGSNGAGLAISADGSVVAGAVYPRWENDTVAFRWTAANGVQLITEEPSTVVDISNDGSVIIGTIDGRTVYRWTAETGMVEIGSGRAQAASADGYVIVGEKSDAPVIWDERYGMRNIQSLLTQEYGVDLDGWNLSDVVDISDDGLTLVGNCERESWEHSGWIATLPAPPSLTELVIVGPNHVPERTSQSFHAVARYDDGSEADVSESATWSIQPEGIAQLGPHGRLTIDHLDESVEMTLLVTYNEGANTYDAQKIVTGVPVYTVYHIDGSNGHDYNSGLTPATAFKTIQKGIDTCEDGDTVWVHPGVYQEQIRYGGKAITVESADDAAVLENPTGFAAFFYDGEGRSSVLKNFVIRNCSTGIFVSRSSPTLRNLTLVHNERGIECFNGDPNVTHCILALNDELDIFGCTPVYSWIQSDPNSVWGNATHPGFVDLNQGDYHLQSQAGHWDPDMQVWVADAATSACIDVGDITGPIGLEPFPNGGVINLGAYGGTCRASKSYFDKPVCNTIYAGDINGDGQIDDKDLDIVMLQWTGEPLPE